MRVRQECGALKCPQKTAHSESENRSSFVDYRRCGRNTGTHFLKTWMKGLYLKIPCLLFAAVMSHYWQSNILHQLLKFLIPCHKICLTVHLNIKTYISSFIHHIVLGTKLYIVWQDWHVNIYLNHDSCIATLNETNQPLLGFPTFQFVCFAPALLLCMFMQPAFCLKTSNFTSHN